MSSFSFISDRLKENHAWGSLEMTACTNLSLREGADREKEIMRGLRSMPFFETSLSLSL